ncbi:hypothetical protein DFH09DRAFT_1081592 [Mycena vulgaris]|nr:hypothetical protein DFH09DRAFT_1081592 [Mycena vulgaris]
MFISHTSTFPLSLPTASFVLPVADSSRLPSDLPHVEHAGAVWTSTIQCGAAGTVVRVDHASPTAFDLAVPSSAFDASVDHPVQMLSVFSKSYFPRGKDTDTVATNTIRTSWNDVLRSPSTLIGTPVPAAQLPAATVFTPTPFGVLAAYDKYWRANFMSVTINHRSSVAVLLNTTCDQIQEQVGSPWILEKEPRRRAPISTGRGKRWRHCPSTESSSGRTIHSVAEITKTVYEAYEAKRELKEGGEPAAFDRLDTKNKTRKLVAAAHFPFPVLFPSLSSSIQLTGDAEYPTVDSTVEAPGTNVHYAYTLFVHEPLRRQERAGAGHLPSADLRRPRAPISCRASPG